MQLCRERSQKDTVCNNQTYIYRKLHTYIVCERFQNFTNDSYQCGNNHQLNDDTDTVGNGVTQQGDNEVREGCNNGYGKTHHDSRFQLSRYSQCRTDTEHLYGDRVIQTQRS